MVDQGIWVEIMYPYLYEGLGLTPEDLTTYDSPLIAFDGTVVMLAGQVTLPVEVGGRKKIVNFIVVHSYSPYIAILGCPRIHAMGAVPLSLHQKVKFPIKQGIAEVCGDQSIARRCWVATVGHRKREKPELGGPLQQLQPPPENIYEQLEKIHIDLTGKYFQVGVSLPTLEKVELIYFLVSNLDVFAWCPYKAPKVDPNFICHRLNVDLRCPLKKQRPHRSLDVTPRQ